MFNMIFFFKVLVSSIFLATVISKDSKHDDYENDEISKTNCEPTDSSCWPTFAQLVKLRFDLNPNLNRSIYWQGGSTPLPGPQIFSYAAPALNNEQPLFGAGQKLEPLYVRPDASDICFGNDFTSNFCKVSAVNAVVTPDYPAFTVFAVTPGNVQVAIKFANEHKLRLCVAGTGADVMTRHACSNGLLLRTTLFKTVKWNNDLSTVTLGSGINFEEAQYQAGLKGRFLVSGWCGIVGIAGWYLNAGHGPFNPQFGNGADNLVSAQMVLSDGRFVNVNENQNSDLFWAIRGGGGSAFGVLITLTIKAHQIPNGGFSLLYVNHESSTNATTVFENYASWALRLSKKWGGYSDYAPNPDGSIGLTSIFAYHGPQTEPNYLDTKASLETALPNSTVLELNFPDALQMLGFYATNIFTGAVSIDPFNYANSPSLNDVDLGGPSAIMTREFVQSGGFVNFCTQIQELCATVGVCPVFSLSQDLTGNIGSPQPKSSTSVSPGMRSGMIHAKGPFLSFPSSGVEAVHAIGPNSYFGESAHTMPDWQSRYWGLRNYYKLLDIKWKYDKKRLFDCYHCVGYNSTAIDF